MTPMPNRLRRVVPKNLFLSALTALDGPTEKGKTAESNIRDLCTLITLSMLYDELETLGHKDELDGHSKPHIAEGYARIRELTGLDIVIGPEPEEADSIIRASA